MKKFSQKNRENVLNKTDGKCFYCGNKLCIETFHIDHAIPKSKGGSDSLYNLLPSCDLCNLQKGSLTIEDYRFALTSRILFPLKKAHTSIIKNKHLTEKQRTRIADRIADIHNEYMKIVIKFYGDDLGVI